MKKIKLAIVAVLLCVSATGANAFDFGALFGGLGNAFNSEVINNVIDGVFSTSNIEVKDLAGQWTTTGSAVNFKSENLLNKAGGVAGAAMIENKLDPYFKKYGLTGSVFTIQVDGSFELKVKKITLNGNITKKEDGNFEFHFQALGKMNVGSVTAYVTKSLNNMNIMFDASKLQSLISGIASLTGNSIAKQASSLINSYDGICIGFKMQKTGTVEGESQVGGVQGLGQGLLDGLLGGNKNSNSNTNNNPSNNTTNNTNTNNTNNTNNNTDNTNNNTNNTNNNTNNTNNNSNNTDPNPANILLNLFNKKK